MDKAIALTLSQTRILSALESDWWMSSIIIFGADFHLCLRFFLRFINARRCLILPRTSSAVRREYVLFTKGGPVGKDKWRLTILYICARSALAMRFLHAQTSTTAKKYGLGRRMAGRGVPGSTLWRHGRVLRADKRANLGVEIA
jgi:hypothetical protein